MRGLFLMLMSLCLLVPDLGRATADGPDVHRVAGIAADDLLNLRRGPGTAYDVIVGLPLGAEVEVFTETQDGWCEVSLNEVPDLTGFVACRYLELAN